MYGIIKTNFFLKLWNWPLIGDARQRRAFSLITNTCYLPVSLQNSFSPPTQHSTATNSLKIDPVYSTSANPDAVCSIVQTAINIFEDLYQQLITINITFDNFELGKMFYHGLCNYKEFRIYFVPQIRVARLLRCADHIFYIGQICYCKSKVMLKLFRLQPLFSFRSLKTIRLHYEWRRILIQRKWITIPNLACALLIITYSNYL